MEKLDKYGQILTFMGLLKKFSRPWSSGRGSFQLLGPRQYRDFLEEHIPIVWCGVVWCGVVWCGVVWCGVPHSNTDVGQLLQ